MSAADKAVTKIKTSFKLRKEEEMGEKVQMGYCSRIKSVLRAE